MLPKAALPVNNGGPHLPTTRIRPLGRTITPTILPHGKLITAETWACAGTVPPPSAPRAETATATMAVTVTVKATATVTAKATIETIIFSDDVYSHIFLKVDHFANIL
jgi:hypothetical protein